MDFVNPWLLLGAATAAIPVVLHLVMRQKPRQLEFPALRFLMQTQEANRRRLRLRHWLLLLLRMAALGLLAFALARPSIQGSRLGADQEAPVAAALIFDTAPRMDYRHENQTRLERAQAMADWLATQLPSGSRLAVLESGLSSAVFQVDVAAARQRISRLRTTSLGSPLPRVMEEAVRLLSTSDLTRKELYVFTDLAQGSWDSAAAPGLAASLDALGGAGLYVIDVGVAEARNLALGPLRLSAQVLPKTAPLRVSTELTAERTTAEQRAVQLWVEDRTGSMQKRSEVNVELSAGPGQPLEFPPLSLDEGTHQGEVKIVGEDGLARDDVRYFTVHVAPAWRVLLAAPSPAEQYTLLLDEALAPEEFRKSGQARFECRTVLLDELAKLPLEPFAAVVLVDPTPLPAAIWQRLAAFARGGGGVAVLLGPNAQPLVEFNSADAQELLAGTLLQQARRDPQSGYLAPTGYTHPLLAKFASLEDRLAWSAYPVTRYWQLAEKAPDAQVILSYRDGQPALVERPLDRGRVLTLTTPLSNLTGQEPWNRLLLEFDAWPALMLVNEMMLYLAGSADNQLNYLAGQTAVLHPRAAQPLTQFVLTTPRGDALRQTADDRQGTLVVGSTESEGNYRIRAGQEGSGLRTGFSVNLPSEATDLTRIQPDALKLLFGKQEFRLARNQEEIDRQVTVGRVGRELYPLFIALVALLLAAEHVMSNRFYRQPEEGAAPP